MKQLILLLLLTLPIAAQPKNAEALVQSSRDAIAHGDPDKAAELLEQAIALAPDNAAYHHRLGNAYGQAAAAGGMLAGMSLGKKAKEQWERAVQLDPDFIPARLALVEFNLMVPAMFGGDEAAATAHANEIRKRDAIEGHRAFAIIHTAAKKPDLARKEYTDLIAEQPSSPRAHYLFGVYLLVTEKHHQEANDQFEAALKLDPSYMPAYFQVGHVAALAGNNFPRGEGALKKYLGYRPKDDEPSLARAHFWLGSLYEKQGRKSQAKASYAASLKINPNQKDAKEAMKRMV